MRVLASIFAGLIAVSAVPVARAFTPEDPEVREMVDRGVRYLESLSEAQLKTAQWGGADGQVILAAYAHLKAEHNEDAPLVQLGLKNAMAFVNSVKKNGGKVEHLTKTTYEVAVAILFLAELDPVRHAQDLQLLGNGLFDLQMSHGGYGYPGEPNGDTSQVQYIVLAMWTLDRAGIEVPLNRVKTTLAWLARVQDVSGSWPYKGVDPGPGKPLAVQPTQEMSVSTSLAGASSLVIGSDVFRLWGQNTSAGNGIEGLPKAVKKLEQEDVLQSRRKQAPLSKDVVLAAASRMDNYRQKNPFKRTAQADWYYYMMYTLERYESFMELALGKPTDPMWYDEGVRSLMSLQDTSGAWGVKDKTWNEPSACTAFAILFLIRSTKKAIGTPATGSLAGGYGLPADTTKIVVSGTQIKGEPTSTAVTDLLDILEADEATAMDPGSLPEGLTLEQDPARRQQQLARLERVVRGSKSWQARRVAARLLGSSDDLRVVPALIYALSDPDGPTRRFAADGLQFISRRFDDTDLPDQPDPAQILKAQKDWMDWYQAIFPNYVFLSDDL
ncbi:MAG: hypothetical protein ACO1RT_07550 [Planctomycetaceae bacterium]